MTTTPSILTLHMVSSLDGMIATRDNSMAWFETPDHYAEGVEVTPEAAVAFLKTIDCYVMGSRTYELALELSKAHGWVYGDTPTIVLTKRSLPVERSNVSLFSGTPEQLVGDVLRPTYKNVWIVGGAALCRDFLRKQLADEIRLSILPILLGDGLRLFEGPATTQPLHLKKVTAHKTGMVELHYAVNRQIA